MGFQTTINYVDSLARKGWAQQFEVGEYKVSQKASDLTWACSCSQWKYQRAREIHPPTCGIMTGEGRCVCQPSAIIRRREDCKHIISIRTKIGDYDNSQRPTPVMEVKTGPTEPKTRRRFL